MCCYSKIWVYVDQERDVVLRSRYWDKAGVEVKEFSAPPARLAAFDGIWVPMESKMRNLLLDSHTQLIITELVPNPKVNRSTFDLGQLEDH